MNYLETARQDLFAMAGHDGHALRLLDALFDVAIEETDVPVKDLRAHCAEPSDKVGDESLNFILVTFPERIRQWVWEEDEAQAQRLWHDTLAALHTLRTAELPCGSCLRVCWNVSQMASAVHGPYCQACWEAHVVIPRGRHTLRAVAS